MTAFTDFTLEGDAILGYFSDKPSDSDRSVRIKTDDDSSTSVPMMAGMPETLGDRIETLIARSLGFPNDAEFDAHSQRMQDLRAKNLQVAEGVPDITREGIRLRITVEVINN